MNQSDFDAMRETYRHRKPQWPRWWYAVGFILALLALVALLNF